MLPPLQAPAHHQVKHCTVMDVVSDTGLHMRETKCSNHTVLVTRTYASHKIGKRSASAVSSLWSTDTATLYEALQ